MGRGIMPARKREESPSAPPPPPPELTSAETTLSKLTLAQQPVAIRTLKPAEDVQTVMTSTGSGGAGGGALSREAESAGSYLKAEQELRIVEHIQRKSPVRKMGEVGEKVDLVTNYIRLKCNNPGVYQYVVHFNPPIDSKYHRIKMVYFLNSIIGDVRLFDGVTLFLPILLKDKV